MAFWGKRLLSYAKTGIEHCHGKTQERRLIQTNISVFIAVITILVFNLAFVLLGNPGLMYSGLVQLPFLLLLPLVLWFNRKGRRHEATLTLFLLVMLDAVSALMLAQGVTLGLQYYFLMFAVLPASYLDAKHWPTTLLLFLSNILLFGYFEVYGWQAHPSIAEVPTFTITLLRIIMVGSCATTVLVVILISEYYAAQNEQELQYLADTDSLTGLPNRRAFMGRLERTIKDRRSFSLLIIDVDHFKQINDTTGHQTGDAALQFLANQLNACIQGEDFAGRIGGEEFAMVQFCASPLEHLVRAESLRKTIASAHPDLGVGPVYLTVSIGVCMATPPVSLITLMAMADNALYEAKRSGRNCVQVAAAKSESVPPWQAVT
ncbi:GGDEF domain-containing protein [Shewanella amazonensis]|nr:GGDEF domain-containing protein [Shewanella amazonensis]